MKFATARQGGYPLGSIGLKATSSESNFDTFFISTPPSSLRGRVLLRPQARRPVTYLEISWPKRG